MRMRIERVAEDDAERAAKFYDGRDNELGDVFMSELRAALKRIADFPHAWPP